jgi:DNA-binding NtrC family response regulator
MALLCHYSWPGNVRELENCLTHALVLARGDVIRPEHVILASAPAAADGKVPSLDDIEREHVERVMAMTGGRKTEAAKTLGVSRPRLDRLLAKYGLC